MFSERHPLGKARDDDPPGISHLELAKVHLLLAFDHIRYAQDSQPGPPSDLFTQLLNETTVALDLLVGLLGIASREWKNAATPPKK